jgi:hypothetical protein
MKRITIIALCAILSGCYTHAPAANPPADLWTLERDNQTGPHVLTTGLALDTCATLARDMAKTDTTAEILCTPQSRWSLHQYDQAGNDYVIDHDLTGSDCLNAMFNLPKTHSAHACQKDN